MAELGYPSKRLDKAETWKFILFGIPGTPPAVLIYHSAQPSTFNIAFVHPSSLSEYLKKGAQKYTR